MRYNRYTLLNSRQLLSASQIHICQHSPPPPPLSLGIRLCYIARYTSTRILTFLFGQTLISGIICIRFQVIRHPQMSSPYFYI